MPTAADKVTGVTARPLIGTTTTTALIATTSRLQGFGSAGRNVCGALLEPTVLPGEVQASPSALPMHAHDRRDSRGVEGQSRFAAALSPRAPVRRATRQDFAASLTAAFKLPTCCWTFPSACFSSPFICCALLPTNLPASS